MMKMPLLVGAIPFLAPGCASNDDAQGRDVAGVELELTTVPSGVQCVSVTAKLGPQVITREFALGAGASSASLSLGQLPAGSATLQGNAYNVACTSIATATPTYVADTLTVNLRPGVVTSAALTFRPNNAVGLSVNFLANVAEVSVGWFVTLARMTDGTLRFWGADPIIGVQRSPAVVSGVDFTAVSQVSLGQQTGCALKLNGTVTCWGYINSGNVSIPPVTVTLPATAVQIAASRSHVCALLSNGQVACWGSDNLSGQLGNGGTALASTSAPAIVPLNSLAGVGKVVVGFRTTCIIDSTGHASCWGDNSTGKFGNGTTVSSLVPVAAATTLGAIGDLQLGDEHACALRADETVFCWGQNANGQVGDGSLAQRLSPTALLGLSGVKQIAAGASHTCAVTKTGALACWGSNSSGQLGDGTGVDQRSPVTLALPAVAAVRANANVHTCAEMQDLTVRCWGFNNAGQLGTGSFANSSVPVTVRLQ